MNEKIQGAEHALKTMAGYYISALKQSGITEEEIKNTIINTLGDIIAINKDIDSKELTRLKEDKRFKIKEMLESSHQLLGKMIAKQKIDLESISIVQEMIETIEKELYKEERR